MNQETKRCLVLLAKQKNASGKDNEIAEIEEEIQELEVNDDKGLFNKIQMGFEKLACTRLGQMFYEQCDRVLKVVEDTAKWGLPQDDNDAKLERPLPWVLFLSLIVWLRIFYFWFNIGSMIVGTPRVTPHSMVYSVQGKRRSLRAIRGRGLKTMRGPESDTMATCGGFVESPPSLMAKLRQLLGRTVCRPGEIRDIPRILAENVSTEKSSDERCSTKRSSDDDGIDLNLTVDQMLDKYGNEDSEDDSDYVPNIEEDDERSISTSSMSSDEEAEAESAESECCSTKRPRHDDDIDLSLTVDKMLDKYGNEDSKDDSDYVPNFEEDDDDDDTMSNNEESEADSAEKHADSNDSALNTPVSADQTVIEVKENGGPKHHRPMPKPIPTNIKLEAFSDADSGNEQVKTPQVTEYSDHFDSQQAEMHNTEVAPKQKQLTTPSPRQEQQIHQQQNKLTFNLDEEAQKKSTPGHMSAAAIKPNLGASSSEAPKLNQIKTAPKDIPSSRSNCSRTITTETCVEYDWSITVKTEITHRRQPTKLPKMDCSVQTLTPASSTEDIFYSPIGSPTEYHTIFHPAPLIKAHSTKVHSTPQENNEGSTYAAATEMPELQEPYQQRKPNKQHQYQHNFHNKYRNKNRR